MAQQIVQVEKSDRKRGGRTFAALATLVTGSLFSLAALAPAAHAADTNATFSLTGGEISISAPLTAALSDGVAGDASVAGSLGSTTVTDDRGSTAGWVASRASTAFTGPGDDILNSAVTYTPGSVTGTTVGDVTPVAGATGVMTTPQTAFSGTLAVGNNEASWTPSIAVALPANAQVGDFAGTITHSVL
jgi:hypothetical protein